MIGKVAVTVRDEEAIGTDDDETRRVALGMEVGSNAVGVGAVQTGVGETQMMVAVGGNHVGMAGTGVVVGVGLGVVVGVEVGELVAGGDWIATVKS